MKLPGWYEPLAWVYRQLGSQGADLREEILAARGRALLAHGQATSLDEGVRLARRDLAESMLAPTQRPAPTPRRKAAPLPLLVPRSLPGPWLLNLLRSQHPTGVMRRTLLEEIATFLVTPRSKKGAKGRVAARLYQRLERLLKLGLIETDASGFLLRAVEPGKSLPWTQVPPEALPPPGSPRRPRARREAPIPDAILRKKLFLALMAKDRGNRAHIHAARFEFISSAMEAGWSLAQAGSALSLTKDQATAVLERAPKKPAV